MSNMQRKILIRYKAPNIQGLFEKRLLHDGELSYINNPASLFRKYKELITWFSNTYEGREYLGINHENHISLLLPNGYHSLLDRTDKEVILDATFYSRNIFTRKLNFVLYQFDLLAPFIRSFTESKEVFLWLIRDRDIYIPNIVNGLTFNTSTFNPDADPESTSVDGVVHRSSVDESLSTIRSSAGNAVSDNGSNSEDSPGIVSSNTSNQYQSLRRNIILFDTSSLPDLANITAATFSTYGTAANTKFNQLGSPDYHLASSSPASNTSLAASDYSNVGTTSFGSIAYASFGADQYNDITLNASGISNITKTGISKFSAQISWDINNSFTGSWLALGQSAFRASFAEISGTSQDPKLAVDFTTTSTSTSTSTTTTSTSTTTTTSTSTTTTSTSTSTSSSTSTSTSTTTTSTSTSTTTTSTSSSTTTSTTTTLFPTTTSTSTSTTTTSTSTSTTTTSTSTTTTWEYKGEVLLDNQKNLEFEVVRKTEQL